MRRASWMAAVFGAASLACAQAASAQGVNPAPPNDPTENAGNTVINNGAGSGTGTDSPGPGMTLKEGSNPTPTASPVENGGNSAVNKGAGSGTGTAEPSGMK